MARYLGDWALRRPGIGATRGRAHVRRERRLASSGGGHTRSPAREALGERRPFRHPPALSRAPRLIVGEDLELAGLERVVPRHRVAAVLPDAAKTAGP